MLYKSQIIERTVYGTAEWRNNQLGKFTSSLIHRLIWQNNNGDTALDIVYRKAGELLTGRYNPSGYSDTDSNIDATDWGIKHEQEAVDKFLEVMQMECTILKKFIHDRRDNRFGCTPDAVLIECENAPKDGYHAKTLEVKCPMNYEKFIALYLCDTPEDLKKENKAYYWQVLHQMQVCGCTEGYFMCYHPYFEQGYKIIHFKAGKHLEDLTLLNEKKAWAISKLNEVLEKFQGISSPAEVIL